MNRSTGDSDELPEGWVAATVNECFLDIRNGTTATQNKECRGIPVSRIETIQRASFDLDRIQHIDDASPHLIETFQYLPGDIALSHINSYEHVGKTAIYVGNPSVFIHGMNLLRLRLAHGHLSPAYLHLYMQADSFRQTVRQSAGQAVNQVSINQRNLGVIPIPIAPLAEQRRIVAKVEELLGRVAAARARLEKLPTLLKRFRQSVLAAACSGKLTEDWRECNPTEDDGQTLVSSLIGQETPRCELSYDVPNHWGAVACATVCHTNRALTYGVIKLGPPLENGIPILRSSDVRPLRIDETSIKRISREIAEQYSRTFLQGGEIVVTVRGTLGGVAVVPTHMKGYNVSREVAVIPLHPKLDQKFFAFAIAALPSQNWLTGVEKGVAYTGVNIEDLKCLPLPVPPLDEQREIVRRVEALFTLADKIEARVKVAMARVEKSAQAILAKAFRGELVPTEAELARQEGRDYEPAGVLLERIHAMRDAQQAGPGSARHRPKTRVKTAVTPSRRRPKISKHPSEEQ